MHAWWLASGYDVVVVDGAFRAQWTDQSRRDIEPVLAPDALSSRRSGRGGCPARTAGRGRP